jgi:pimeloyl-ACP methyl ester carboxylesterase
MGGEYATGGKMPLSGDEKAMRPWDGLEGFNRSISLGKGRELFAFDSGAGERRPEGLPVVVLLHGLGDEADTWRHLFPLLSGRARLIAPDLPGFGRSVARGRVTLSSCADAIGALLKVEAPDGAFLVGSSLGAALAELVALRNPGLVRGLVLVDGGAPMTGGSSKGILGMLMPGLGERQYRSLRGDDEAAYRSLSPYYAEIGLLPERDRSFLARRVVERVESDSQMRAYFSLFRSFALWLLFRAGGFRRAIAAFEGPLLIVWGGRDHVASRATADLLSGLARNARIVDVSEAGHLVQQECPAELAAAIAEILQ